MPFLWAALPVPGGQSGPQKPAISSTRTAPVPSGLSVLYAQNVKEDYENQVLIYDGDVVALYGDERVNADHLELHYGPLEQRAVARGNVVLTDPDGTVKARDLEFSWNPQNRFATAKEVTVNVAGTSLTARTAFLTADLWTFDDFEFTTDSKRPPLYQVRGRTIWIYPGRYARILRPSVYLFGSHILTWPVQRLNLDPRTTGIRPPSPEYRDGTWGISWISGTFLSRQATLEWHYDAFRGSWPGYGVQLNRSFIAEKNATGLISPRTNLWQRFDFGYLETVLVGSPESEAAYLARPRSTLSGMTIYNAAVSGRGASDETFSFPAQAVYEFGGKSGQFASITDIRLMTIRRLRDDVKTRGEVETSVGMPTLLFSPNLSLISRVDASAIEGAHSFQWTRASSGLVYRPQKWLTLSGGVMGAVENGTPDFDIDPLVYKNGFILRADYNLGPRRLSLMTRYDSRLKWFDDEVLFTQVMGPLQGYIVYREYPSDFRFGVFLRLDQISDVLKRRSLNRPATSGSSGR